MNELYSSHRFGDRHQNQYREKHCQCQWAEKFRTPGKISDTGEKFGHREKFRTPGKNSDTSGGWGGGKESQFGFKLRFSVLSRVENA